MTWSPSHYWKTVSNDCNSGLLLPKTKIPSSLLREKRMHFKKIVSAVESHSNMASKQLKFIKIIYVKRLE